MKIRYAPLAVACALMVAAAATTTAQAAAVTYYFGGALSTSGLPPLAIGDTFTGSFTYETTAIDVSPNAAFGIYDASFAIDATVNGYSFSSSTSASDCPACGGIQVQNNLNGFDGFAAISGLNLPLAPVIGPSLDGFLPIAVGALLFDPSGTVFNSNVLPSALALSSFQDSEFILTFGNDFERRSAAGFLTYLSTTAPPVPEASTSAMLALGLGALAVVRRRKGH